MDTNLLLKLFTVLLTGGAVYFATKFVIAYFLNLQIEGYSLHSTFIVSKKTPDSVPFPFQLKDYSYWLLPLVRKLQKNKRFEFINKSLEEYNSLLVVSGLNSYFTAEHVQAIAFLFAGIVGVLSFLVVWIILDFGLFLAIIAFVGGVFLGYKIPQRQLKSWIKTRVSLIEKRLPFAIEFILLGIEAGADFVSSIRSYCKEMPNEPLTEELNVFLYEFSNFGQGQKESLRALASRVQSKLFASFILAVETALETGLPIKQTLQIQSKAVSQTRYESAEEIAKGASTKALGPLMMAVIAALLILLGPMLLNVSKSVP